ncbi:DUF1128 domain-containing protein [Paenibacillus sp. y28]|uniref:DUF1128 domain-containing protein n=1 Tax=Paenibacillus sp. y28 TaxID=3129110 RepID=UPI003019A17E
MHLTDRVADIARMVEDIKAKLKVVTAASIKAETLDESRFEDIKDIHNHVMSRSQFSISEIEALCDELRSLRKA